MGLFLLKFDIKKKIGWRNHIVITIKKRNVHTCSWLGDTPQPAAGAIWAWRLRNSSWAIPKPLCLTLGSSFFPLLLPLLDEEPPLPPASWPLLAITNSLSRTKYYLLKKNTKWKCLKKWDMKYEKSQNL